MTQIKRYSLKNQNGVAVEFLNFGGIVTKILAPDRNGALADVVLGFDDLELYAKSNPSYYGALIGRFANRIGGASVPIHGEVYKVTANEGSNALHGGRRGFDKVYWDVREIKANQSYELSYLSAHLEEGFPGNLLVKVTYSLDEKNAFSIHYKAQTDQTTHVNLTHHSYFNLSGDLGSTIFDHEIQISSDSYTVADGACIPTGEIRKLNELLDFRTPRKIGEYVEQIQDGYNHNYILKNSGADKVAATVHHPASGRKMEVFTTEPGLQFYSGHYLDPKLPGKNGVKTQSYGGFALEAQHFPDSPNKPGFPSTLLTPGKVYEQTTTYKFSVES